MVSLIKWILITIGAISTYYMTSLQIQYGVTSKVISEMISPTLHPDAMEKVYMPMTNTLLDTGDITMASIVRVKVADDVSNEDVEEAMESIATAEGIRSVGMLPLSEMVELQTGEKQRFLKIYQYMSPKDSVVLANYNPEFSAFLPIRISLAEDRNGKMWLYSIDIDSIFRSGKVINPKLDRLLLELKRVINAIMIAGKTGDF